jgi:hypothetical protein
VTITSAILEFLVLGCLWICVFLVIAIVAIGALTGSWPRIDLEGLQPAITFLGIPVAYCVGVVLQAATWHFWYKRLHRKALDREMAPALPKGKLEQFWYKLLRRKPSSPAIDGGGERNARHKAAYQRLADSLRNRGLETGLKDDLQTGRDLGGLLDVLRWELLASPQSEPAKQYLVQFHLYRILYGSIPPLFVLGITLGIGFLVALRLAGRSAALAFIIGAVLALSLSMLAFAGASHRRSRTWKYLVFGVQAQTTHAAERQNTTADISVRRAL